MNNTAGNGLDRSDKNKSKRNLILTIILAVITAAAIGITVWALFFRDTIPTLAPDYAPQQTEENAEPIGDDSDEKLEAAQGGGAVSLTYSKDVKISLSDKSATLLFGNPTKSTQDMVVQLVIKNTVVIQSGRLTPGNQVTKLNLLSGAEKELAEGGYDGKFVILYYNQETGEKAVVNTEIPVNITVNK